MSQPGSAAVLDRQSIGAEMDDENLTMADETPGMDDTAPMRYVDQSTGNSDPEPEAGTHSPDQAQNGQGSGGTSDGD